MGCSSSKATKVASAPAALKVETVQVQPSARTQDARTNVALTNGHSGGVHTASDKDVSKAGTQTSVHSAVQSGSESMKSDPAPSRAHTHARSAEPSAVVGTTDVRATAAQTASPLEDPSETSMPSGAAAKPAPAAAARDTSSSGASAADPAARSSGSLPSASPVASRDPQSQQSLSPTSSAAQKLSPTAQVSPSAVNANVTSTSPRPQLLHAPTPQDSAAVSTPPLAAPAMSMKLNLSRAGADSAQTQDQPPGTAQRLVSPVPMSARDAPTAEMQRKAEIPMLRAASAASLAAGRSMYDLFNGGNTAGSKTGRAAGTNSPAQRFMSREQLVIDALNSRRVAMDVAGTHVQTGRVKRVRRGSIKGDSAATQDAVSALEVAIQASVAANPAATDWQSLATKIKIVAKTDVERSTLAEALGRNFLFSGMSMEERHVIVDAMDRATFSAGGVIIEQGKPGDRCFVVETGLLEVLVNGETVGELDVGEVFGELSLLYGSPNAATIRAVFPASLWALDRTTFRNVVLTAAVKQFEDSKRFLRGVTLLSKLSDSQIARLAEASQRVHFTQDTRIVNQGELGEIFYIVMKGLVKVLKRVEEVATGAKAAGAPASASEEGDGDGIGPLHSARDPATTPSHRGPVGTMSLPGAAATHGAGDVKPSPRQPAAGAEPLRLTGGPSAVSLHVAQSTNDNEVHSGFVADTADASKVARGEKQGRVSMRGMVGGVAIPDAQLVEEGDSDDEGASRRSSTLSSAVHDAHTVVEMEIMRLEVGSYFGDQALLNDAPRAASVVAVTDVTCLALHRDDFFTLLGPLAEILRTQHANRQEVEKTVRRLHSQHSFLSTSESMSPRKGGPDSTRGTRASPHKPGMLSPQGTTIGGVPLQRTFTFTERQMEITSVAEPVTVRSGRSSAHGNASARSSTGNVSPNDTARTGSDAYPLRSTAGTPQLASPTASASAVGENGSTSTPASGALAISTTLRKHSSSGSSSALASIAAILTPGRSADAPSSTKSASKLTSAPSFSMMPSSSGTSLTSPSAALAVAGGHRSSMQGRGSMPQLAPITESPRADTEASPKKTSSSPPSSQSPSQVAKSMSATVAADRKLTSPLHAASSTGTSLSATLLSSTAADVTAAPAPAPAASSTALAAPPHSMPSRGSTGSAVGVPGSLSSLYASNTQAMDAKRMQSQKSLPPDSSRDGTSTTKLPPISQAAPAPAAATSSRSQPPTTATATSSAVTTTSSIATMQVAPSSSARQPINASDLYGSIAAHAVPAPAPALAPAFAPAPAPAPPPAPAPAPAAASARLTAPAPAPVPAPAMGAAIPVGSASAAASAPAPGAATGRTGAAPSARSAAAAGFDASTARPGVGGRSDIRLTDLEYIAILGEGAFGLVRLVRHKHSGEVWALKQMQKAKIVAGNQMRNVVNEKKILARLRHPFIIEFIKTFKDRDCLFLLSEYCPGGDLFGMLIRQGGTLSVPDATWYAAAVASVLEYVHSMDIVYRDLKPENLLLDGKGYLKVCDFGFAKVVTDRTYTLCGTPEYLAPELVQGRGHGKGVDWWALGILIYEMLVGYSPFADHEAQEQVTIYKNILRGNLRFPSALRDANAKDIIKKLLTPNPTQRLGCLRGGGADVRKHPFFARMDFDALQRRAIPPPVPLDVKSPTDTSHFDHIDADTRITPYVDNGDPWDLEF